MNAIPTMYGGIEFRSRLEARWAAFFHNIGWRWTYEPFDANGYIPDFLVHGPMPLLIEVKPALLEREYRAPIAKIEQGLAGCDADVLIVGIDPIASEIENDWGTGLEHPSAGIVGEYLPPNEHHPAPERDFAAGIWMTCARCAVAAVAHTYQSYASRPCGHYDGDHYMGDADTNLIRMAWAAATNTTKWAGR